MHNGWLVDASSHSVVIADATFEAAEVDLEPDDILIIERNRTFIMYGEVNSIGEFPIAGDTTVFKAILAARGVKLDENDELMDTKCPRCKEINPPKTQRCGCGQALTPQAIQENAP